MKQPSICRAVDKLGGSFDHLQKSFIIWRIEHMTIQMKCKKLRVRLMHMANPFEKSDQVHLHYQ